MTKRCGRCGQTKSIDDFYGGRGKGNTRATCIVCENIAKATSTPSQKLAALMDRPSEIIGNKYKYKVKQRRADGAGVTRYHFHDKFGDEILPDSAGHWLPLCEVADLSNTELSPDGFFRRLHGGNIKWNEPPVRRNPENGSDNAMASGWRSRRAQQRIRDANKFLLLPAARHGPYLVDGGIPV